MRELRSRLYQIEMEPFLGVHRRLHLHSGFPPNTMSCRVSSMVVSHYYQRGEQARPQPFLRVSYPSRTTHPHSSESVASWAYLVMIIGS